MVRHLRKEAGEGVEKPYLKSRATTSWKDEWVKFAKEITEEQQKELAPEEENSSNTRLEPYNAETGKAWGTSRIKLFLKKTKMMKMVTWQ